MPAVTTNRLLNKTKECLSIPALIKIRPSARRWRATCCERTKQERKSASCKKSRTFGEKKTANSARWVLSAAVEMKYRWGWFTRWSRIEKESRNDERERERNLKNSQSLLSKYYSTGRIYILLNIIQLEFFIL